MQSGSLLVGKIVDADHAKRIAKAASIIWFIDAGLFVLMWLAFLISAFTYFPLVGGVVCVLLGLWLRLGFSLISAFLLAFLYVTLAPFQLVTLLSSPTEMEPAALWSASYAITSGLILLCAWLGIRAVQATWYLKRQVASQVPNTQNRP